MLCLHSAALALALSLTAQAYQEGSSPQAKSTSAVTLHNGQPVVLRNIDPISSNHSKPGDAVQFEVIRDVASDGLVVIPEHAIAAGTVESAEHAKLAHHGGRLAVAIENVQLANGDHARLRAVESRKEHNFGWRDVGAATLIAATIYYMPLAPVYLVAKGEDVNIPPGTRFTAYIDGDVTVERSSLEAIVPVAGANPEVATIFIYRGNQDKEPGLELPVSCGLVYLAGLTDSTFTMLTLSPGRYWFYTLQPSTKLSAGQQAKQMRVLDVEAGKKYYLEVAFEPAKWKTFAATIREADEPAGQEAVFMAESMANAFLPSAGSKQFAKLSAKPRGVKTD